MVRKLNKVVAIPFPWENKSGATGNFSKGVISGKRQSNVKVWLIILTILINPTVIEVKNAEYLIAALCWLRDVYIV